MTCYTNQKFKLSKIYISKALVVFSIITILSVFLVGCTQSENHSTVNYKEYVNEYEALEIAKQKFEYELKYSQNSEFTKTYTPSYGKCDVEDGYNENYWLVTVRGSYRGYKDTYATGELVTKTFAKSYFIEKYQYK